VNLFPWRSEKQARGVDVLHDADGRGRGRSIAQAHDRKHMEHQEASDMTIPRCGPESIDQRLNTSILYDKEAYDAYKREGHMVLHHGDLYLEDFSCRENFYGTIGKGP